MDGSCTDDSTATTTTDSLSISITPPPPKSLCRVGSGASLVIDSESGVEAESRKLPSSKYKGVVPQPNGRWGAQIYEKHQRVWLGTFNEEDDAARAYDIAALRFRGRDGVINLRRLNDGGIAEEDVVEEAFLNLHSKAEIVDMLRKHTYDDELEQSKRSFRTGGHGANRSAQSLCNSNVGFSGSDRLLIAREQLFEKAVTPSDVGKLNRLVIPKQHAERHFPLRGGSDCGTNGVLINLEDVAAGKVWRFRYSYWNSSQSYVLTKGWSRFVKEKGLKTGDVVSFLRSTGPDRQLYIDWKPRMGGGSDQVCCPPVRPVQMMRLFGVNIFKVGEGKRSSSEMELLCSNSGKKQRTIGVL